MLCIPYSSYTVKRNLYVERVLPAIVQVAMRGRVAAGSMTPAQIHDWARGGIYIGEEWSGDCLFEVDQTASSGGDCEDWAAVLVSLALSRRIPVRLVTAGDELDPYRHTYVEFYDRNSGSWVASNPKGSQQGMPYGQHPEYEVYQRWSVNEVGQLQLVPSTSVAVRPRGSGCDCVKGSAADPDPVIKSRQDMSKWLTSTQSLAWKRSYSSQEWFAVDLLLSRGRGSLRRSQILQRIGDKIVATGAKIAASGYAGGAAISAAAQTYAAELQEVKSLAAVNRVMAAYWAAEFTKAGAGQQQRIAELRRYAISVGGNPNADDQKLMTVASFVLAQNATTLGCVFDEWQAEVQKIPNWQEAFKADAKKAAATVYARLKAAGKVDGIVAGSGEDFIFGSFGRGFASLINNPAKWFTNIVKEIGKGMKALAENVFDAEKVPFLGDFFLKPLGFHAQATLLMQLGNVLVENSVSAFDERALGLSVGETFVAAGTALVAASPFIPQPFGTLALVVGAISIAVGNIMLIELTKDEVAAIAATPVQYTVDEYGRVIDPADGLPVDPYQRQTELARRAAAAQSTAVAVAAPDPNTQQPGEWRQGSNGFWFGWDALNTQQYWWTAVQVNGANQIVAAWYYNQGGWVQL